MSVKTREVHLSSACKDALEQLVIVQNLLQEQFDLWSTTTDKQVDHISTMMQYIRIMIRSLEAGNGPGHSPLFDDLMSQLVYRAFNCPDGADREEETNSKSIRATRGLRHAMTLIDRYNDERKQGKGEEE